MGGGERLLRKKKGPCFFFNNTPTALPISSLSSVEMTKHKGLQDYSVLKAIGAVILRGKGTKKDEAARFGHTPTINIKL